MTILDTILKSRDITLPTNVCLIKAMIFPVVMWMWELDHKERWVLKYWCFWTVVLEETVESPLDCKKIKPVHPKENQSWIFIGRTDAEAEAPILWLPDAKSWFIRKDPDAGKDWGQEKKETTEDEMFRWHHQLNGYEFEHWEMVKDREAWHAAVHGVSESDTIEWLNNNNRLYPSSVFPFAILLLSLPVHTILKKKKKKKTQKIRYNWICLTFCF